METFVYLPDPTDTCVVPEELLQRCISACHMAAEYARVLSRLPRQHRAFYTEQIAYHLETLQALRVALGDEHSDHSEQN
jgi:hypothetical protein